MARRVGQKYTKKRGNRATLATMCLLKSNWRVTFFFVRNCIENVIFSVFTYSILVYRPRSGTQKKKNEGRRLFFYSFIFVLPWGGPTFFL